LSRQWELTFLLLAFNKLVEERRDIKRRNVIKTLDSEVKKVYSSTGLTVDGGLSDVFEAAATMLRNLPFTFKVQAPFVPVSIELKDSESPEPPTPHEAIRLQNIVIQSMYGIVGMLLEPSTRVQILADQLDDFWTASAQQVASLCALINAVMRMKSVLLQRGMDESLNFSVFLRSDIYAVLKENGLDDASKYRRHEWHLKWDEPELRELVERRFEVAQVDSVRRLEDVFEDGRIERRSLVDYFFARLVPRPRDVIQFLVDCLEQARRRRDQKISADALLSAEEAYSGWRRGVITEETKHGAFRSPREVLDSLSSGPRTYTSQDLNRRLVETKKEYGITETKPYIVSALVDGGVLGVQRSDGTTVFIWDVPEGKRPTPRDADEENEQEYYVVHPSLWNVLELRAPRKRRARVASS
jgi:hypothetical protein